MSSDIFSRLPWTKQDITITITATTKTIHVHPYSQKFETVEEAIKFHLQELQGRIELLGSHHIQVSTFEFCYKQLD